MPRGYRSAGFAALVAAILLSFGLGAYWASLDKPEQPNRYPSYQSGNGIQNGSLATAPNVSIGAVKHTPCQNPKSETESDLCAQWRAAKAAEKSADWTLYGVIASAIGISLLLWQIMLTREAVKDTGDATIAMKESNRIAREIGEAQARAHLAIKNASFVITDNRLHLVFDVENTGQTLAVEIKVRLIPTLMIRYGSDGKMPHFEDHQGSDRDINVGVCPPHSIQTADAMWSTLEFGPINASFIISAPPEHTTTVTGVFEGYIEWTDVFGETQDIWFNLQSGSYDILEGQYRSICTVSHRVSDTTSALAKFAKNQKTR